MTSSFFLAGAFRFRRIPTRPGTMLASARRNYRSRTWYASSLPGRRA
jgi:hypothetical protein